MFQCVQDPVRVADQHLISQSGGPNVEVSSYAWQVALNLSATAWFSGVQDFDFLGERK
jgi:hypothetical protein